MDDDALDLDEEEMRLLWRKLSKHAKRKKMRERDAAAAWMNQYGGGSGSGSFAMASPGERRGKGTGTGGGGWHGNHFKMAHSFSSPVERPELPLDPKGGSDGTRNVGENRESGSSDVTKNDTASTWKHGPGIADSNKEKREHEKNKITKVEAV